MLNRSLFVLLLFGSLMACSPQGTGHSTSAPAASSQATSVSQSSTAPTKTTTIQVEGKQQTIPLEFLQTRYFSTYFPTDRFVVKQENSDSSQPFPGQQISFYWKQPDGTVDKNAVVVIFFPTEPNSMAELKERVLGDTAMLQIDWRKIEQSPAISDAKRNYSDWLREVVRHEQRTSSKNRATTAYLGEVQGRAFLIRSVYPFQYGEQFTSREKVLLENLKFESKNSMK